jgi:hypothetical protein
MVGNRIRFDDRPRIAWKPVKTRGQIDWAPARCAKSSGREAIVRQARTGMA